MATHQIPKIDYVLWQSLPIYNAYFIITDYFTTPTHIPCRNDFSDLTNENFTTTARLADCQ